MAEPLVLTRGALFRASVVRQLKKEFGDEEQAYRSQRPSVRANGAAFRRKSLHRRYREGMQARGCDRRHLGSNHARCEHSTEGCEVDRRPRRSLRKDVAIDRGNTGGDGAAERGRNKRYIGYNSTELKWIEANAKLPRRDLHAKFVQRFKRADVALEHIKALCTRKGWKTGRTGCFEKGSIPANKGKKMPFNANSARTQFKPGQKPTNTNPIGHERIGKDGYIEVRVAEPKTFKGGQTTFYRQKHRHLWELANGPVPQGHVLKSIDGDRTNTNPENWMAIPQAMLPRLSGRWSMGYDDAPDELKPFLLAVAQLEQSAREKRRELADG